MLNKKLVPLAFGQGLDTKKDKKQQLWGKLRVAENVVFETLDSARKRNGYDSIILRTTDGASISTAQHLSKFKDELLLFDASKLYGFSNALQAMQAKGTIYSVFPTSWPVINNGFNNTELSMLCVSGLKVFAYRNSVTNDVRYAVQDQSTQTLIVTDALVATNARTPKVSAIGNIVYIFYGDSTNIKFKTFNIAQPRTLSSAVTLVANYSTSFSNMDVVSTANRIVVAYCSTNALQRLTLISVNQVNTISNPVPFVGQDPTHALCLQLDTNNRLVVSYADATTAKYTIYAANLLGSLCAPTTLQTISSPIEFDKITSFEASPGNYVFLAGIKAAELYNHKISKITANISAVVGTPSDFLLSVDLASKGFSVQGSNYVLVSYDSVAQPSYFVVDSNAVVVAKISPGVAGGHLETGTVPSVYAVSDDIIIVPSLYRTKLVAENGNFFSLNGVLNTEVDFVVEDRYANTQLGNNLLIGGGIVQSYDGETIAEHSFNIYPELPTLTALTTGTATNWPSLAMDNSASALDTYGYCIVYRWTDNQGQEHRSAASEVANIHLASGASEIGVQLDIPTLRITQKSNAVVEVYRTELNGTVFYLANDIEIPFLNSTSADSVQFIDGRPDSALISGQVLYTTGGVLENIAAPSARIVATHTASQRVFLAGLENPNTIQYSKIAFPGQPVEFNDALTIALDPIGGPITAITSMDEKAVIFEQDAIFFISGAGPNNTGQQNNFSTPERVSTDVGCLDPKSVVLTPEGLMFKSRKGIYLLSRALELSYIGAPVEAFNTLTVSSAKVVGELNQVRFTTTDGDCLVYNYVYKFWATFTNHKAKSAEVIDNSYYYLRINNELYKENRTSFADAGIPIKMRLEIGWISFAILQGYARVYKMLVLGDWLSNHNLLVKVGYDFNEAWTQSVVITPDTAGIDAVAYGNDSPYGLPASKPYGGTGSPYQARVNFKQQKCQSIKLQIEDTQENAGEGFSLSQITFEVGGKAGLFKLSKNKKFGMS